MSGHVGWKAAFLSVPNYGHIYPTLPVVAGLVQQGERVVYYAHEDFRGEIASTGAEFRTFRFDSPDDYKRRPPTLVHLGVRMLEHSLRVLPKLLEDIERENYEYIIHDCACPWGRFAAQILRLPAVSSVCLLPITPRIVAKYVNRAALVRQAVRGAPSYLRFKLLARRLHRQYGVSCASVLSVFSNYSGLNLVYTAREFVPDAHLFDDSFRFVGPALPQGEAVGDFPLDRLEGRRVIYIALGTHRNEAPDFFRACMTAFADLPELVVMSTGRKISPEALLPHPQNFIVRSWVPQVEVLKRTHVYVTHGGMNSCNQALYFGVPMVVSPRAPDLVIQARRLNELGLGRIVWPDRARPSELRRATLEVMADPQVRAAVRAIQKSLQAAGGSDQAVREILAFRTRVPGRAAPARGADGR